MIIDINTGKIKENIPHGKDYRQWRSKLSDNDYSKIVEDLNSKIDGEEIHTAGWMPGSDWTGTAYEPIYNALGKNQQKAAMFFGLIVYTVFMDRPEKWGFGRFELEGKHIRSLTYFRLE